jgi:hypothetical protein
MLLVCAIFIQNPVAVFAAVGAIGSIAIGIEYIPIVELQVYSGA